MSLSVTIINNRVFDDVMQCSLVDMYPWKPTRPHIPPDQTVNSHRQQNLTPHAAKQ